MARVSDPVYAGGRRQCHALVHHDQRHWRASIAHDVGLDPSFQVSYEQYYASLNPWIKLAPEMFVAGKVGCSHQVLGNSELRKTEFYDGYLAPQDFFYSFGGTVRNAGRNTYEEIKQGKPWGIIADGE